jgi:hypothetical protein
MCYWLTFFSEICIHLLKSLSTFLCYIKYEIFTAMKIHIVNFWPWHRVVLACGYRRFGRTYWLQRKYLQDYAVLRIQKTTIWTCLLLTESRGGSQMSSQLRTMEMKGWLVSPITHLICDDRLTRQLKGGKSCPSSTLYITDPKWTAL